MNDLDTSDSTTKGPGLANLIIVALSSVAIVVGAVALVAGLSARKAVDALRADIEAQGATVATTDQNLRNLTGQIDRLFRQVGDQFTAVSERMNAKHKCRLICRECDHARSPTSVAPLDLHHAPASVGHTAKPSVNGWGGPVC